MLFCGILLQDVVSAEADLRTFCVRNLGWTPEQFQGVRWAAMAAVLFSGSYPTPNCGDDKPLRDKQNKIMNATERVVLQPDNDVDIADKVVVLDLVCMKVPAMQVRSLPVLHDVHAWFVSSELTSRK